MLNVASKKLFYRVCYNIGVVKERRTEIAMKKLTTKEIIDTIKGIKKGTWVRLEKQKYLDKDIKKITSMTIRLGVDYTHIKAVGKDHCGQLPWGHWVEGLEGLVIEHKGHYYLRVANAYTKGTYSNYYIGGQEVSKESVEKLIGSEKLETKENAIYNIKFENIIKIG